MQGIDKCGGCGRELRHYEICGCQVGAHIMAEWQRTWEELEMEDAEKMVALAKEARSGFERGTRSISGYSDPVDGPLRRPIWLRKDDTPDWVRDLCWESHNAGEMLPDDWKYEWIVDALDAIEAAEGDEDEAASQMETGVDFTEWDLYTWLRDAKGHYVEQAIDEQRVSRTESLSDIVTVAQMTEREEVFRHVWTFLETKIKEDEYASVDRDDDPTPLD